jgi:MoxR-like ATPase
MTDTGTEPYIPSGEFTQNIVKLIDATHAANVTPLLWGDSGIGKTSLIESLSRREGHSGLTKVMLNSMDRTDALGLPRGGEIAGQHATVYSDPFWIVEANAVQDGLFYVFFDEFSLADPEMQGSCLTILHSRTMPSGTRVKDHVKFIAAGNPAEIITNGYELSPPLANRLMHLDYKPPVSEWYQGMIDAWGRNVDDEERKLRITITAFLKRKPELVQQTEGHQTWRAWPSRRSWDNAATVAAHLSGDLRMTAIAGLVGEGPAVAFAAFAKGFVLPEPKEIADDPSLIDWKDAVQGYAALASVRHWCDDESKFDDTGKVFNYAVTHGPRDVPVVFVQDLLDAAAKISKKQIPLDISPEGFGRFVNDIFPMYADSTPQHTRPGARPRPGARR